MWEGEEEVGGTLWMCLGGHRLGTLAEPILAEPILGGSIGGSIGELLIE